MLSSIGECATLACILEVCASKPGNVHRGADFSDLRFLDFLVSATVIGPILEHASSRGVGRAVRDAVRATRAVVASNTNLGLVLLLTPLAAVPRNEELRGGVSLVLERLKPADAMLVYEAIRIAQPGGLGRVESLDVAAAAPPNLLDAMRAAADRDQIAKQYVTGFQDVFESIVPWLVCGCEAGLPLTLSVVHAQLQWMSRAPDSLIARKCGLKVAQQASVMAEQVLSAGAPFDEGYERALAEFDFWLRSDGHRRNPGTTADLLAAGLFVVLRDGLRKPPYQ